MHRDAPTYGPGQRELVYGSVEQAEAAARVFQKRGYRRRSRSLVPGDVLVAENAEGGFSVVWIPQDQAAPPSPGGRVCDGRDWMRRPASLRSPMMAARV